MQPRFSDHSPPLSELAQRERDHQREFATAEVPFIDVDGRRALPLQAVRESPELTDFVKRFVNCFEYDPHRELLLFLEDNQLRTLPPPTFIS